MVMPLGAAESLEATEVVSATVGAGFSESTISGAGIPSDLLDELWMRSEAESCGIGRLECADILASVGEKHNHGLPAGAHPDQTQKAAFYRGLRLPELVLAHACALGKELAWERFLREFRGPLTQAAIAITRSSSLGSELADSLYSELFGLKEQAGLRLSPLASYSGRGSLLGWLRTTLVQRHVDHHRRTHREMPLDTLDPPELPVAVPIIPVEMAKLRHAVSRVLLLLDPEDRFLLMSYFLDRQTLLQIARLLHVHEATISRRLKRLTSDLRKSLLKNLQSQGMNKREAEEALGTDPRDLEINLRSLLQSSPSATFNDQTNQAGLESK
jgi:RNA polymerase sigma-70 factor (ECF subfamily)